MCCVQGGVEYCAHAGRSAAFVISFLRVAVLDDLEFVDVEFVVTESPCLL